MGKVNKKVIAKKGDLSASLDKLAQRIKKNLDVSKVKPVKPVKEGKSDVKPESKLVKEVNPGPDVTSEFISTDQAKRSTTALLTWLGQQDKNNKLFSDNEPVFLQVVCIKIPKCPRYTIRMSIPNTLLTPTSDICLFVGDLRKGRKTDHEPTIHHYEDLLRSKGVDNIKTIIPMRQVKTEYDQYELRRRLAGLYDHFLAEAKITKHLNKKLGKIFLKNKKVPIPINLKQGDLKTSISKALNKTCLYIHPDGDTCMIQVGHTQQKSGQILENIVAVVKSLAKKYPGGFENVRSLHLKSELSPAIPIYISLKHNSEVQTPVIQPKRPKEFAPVEGELTTLFDQKVRVLPTGEVEVLNAAGQVKKGPNEKQVKLNKNLGKKKPLQQKKKPLQQQKKPLQQNNVANVVDTTNKRKKKQDNSDSEDDAIINTAEEEYLAQYSSGLKSKKQKKSKKLKEN